MKIFALKKNSTAILTLLLVAGYCSYGQLSDPEWDACLHEAQQLYDRGQFYDIQKKIDQCRVEHINVLDAINAFPMYKLLALTYYQLKMFDVAEKYMDTLMRINPTYHPTYPYELAKMTEKYRSRLRRYATVSIGLLESWPTYSSVDNIFKYQTYRAGMNLSACHLWQYDFGKKDLRGVIGEFGFGINFGQYSETRAKDSLFSFAGTFSRLTASVPLRIGFGFRVDHRGGLGQIIVGLNNEFQINSRVWVDYPYFAIEPSYSITELRKFYSSSLEIGVRYWSTNWSVEWKFWRGLTYMLRGNTSSGSYLPAADAYPETDFILAGTSVVVGIPLQDYSTKRKK